MKIIRKILAAVFLIFIVIISVVPFLWVLSSSFKGNAEIMSSVVGYPNGLQLDNYAKAFEIAPLTTFYKNSILVAIIATILNLLIFSMAAYVLVRCRFRFKGLITMLFSAALVIPGAALLQPLYQTLNSAHLYDTLTGLIVVYAALGMPTTLYIMMSYYKTISPTLEEAAYIDGAGFFIWRKLHILMEQDFSEHLYKLFCRLRDRHLRLPGYFSSCFVGMNSSLR